MNPCRSNSSHWEITADNHTASVGLTVLQCQLHRVLVSPKERHPISNCCWIDKKLKLINQSHCNKCCGEFSAASCLRTIIYQLNLNKRSLTSSATTIICAIMKVSPISRPLTFTSGAGKPSYSNVKGSNTRLSKNDASIMAVMPLKMKQ
jgi:hypothetical protein